MSIFRFLGRSKESFKVRGPVYHFVTRWFCLWQGGLARRRTPKLKDYPLSAFRNCIGSSISGVHLLHSQTEDVPAHGGNGSTCTAMHVPCHVTIRNKHSKNSVLNMWRSVQICRRHAILMFCYMQVVQICSYCLGVYRMKWEGHVARIGRWVMSKKL
jgi:hypothetical protein